jgi:hypothetical protein
MNIHIQETTHGWLLEVDNRTIGIHLTWEKALVDLTRYLTANPPVQRLRFT